MTFALGMAQGIFWFSLLAVVYAYIGYPFILWCLTRRKKATTPSQRTEAFPAISIVIPAYNEEKVIGEKIRNILDSNYPKEALDVVVLSDCSTDGTDRITSGYADRGVRLVRQEKRRGKTAGLNRVMGSVREEIIVFTDANAMFPPGTLKRMADRFSDPEIGMVTGSTRYQVSENGETTEITNTYTRLERFIKRAETRQGSCVGADGAVFAMRRSLYGTLREDDINDFVLPMKVVDAGYRCVFDDEIFCSEHSGKDLGNEFRRQSRITNRTLLALWRYRRLLNPFRYGLFSWHLASHKVARYLAPIFLLSMTASLVPLAIERWSFRMVLMGWAVLLVLPTLRDRYPFGILGQGAAGTILRLCHAFLVINLAMLHGWGKILTGRVDVMWQPGRADG